MTPNRNDKRRPDSHSDRPVSPLPRVAGITTDILSGAFRNTTNSYKHIFFRALLDEIAHKRAEIPLAGLAAGMMEKAWWPGFHFRLNLGVRDMVVSRIERAVDVDTLRRDPHAARRAFEQAVKGSRDPLLRFVPQRFLRPWFAGETRGLPDHQVDGQIVRLSRGRDSIAPYRIEPDRIVIAQPWMRFLSENLSFVRGWSDALWIEYLEARNPGASGIVSKIRPALGRPSLADQAALWRAVMKEDTVRCIYTGEMLHPDKIALDHFVPRSFVSHDRIWNLTPTTPAINSSKSDCLPDLRFVPVLAEQHTRIARAATHLEGRPAVVWRRALDEVVADLRIGPDTLHRPEELSAVYHDMLGGLVSIASRMGFPANWSPKS